jgi:tetratricopeptide (TPR) repeat protein
MPLARGPKKPLHLELPAVILAALAFAAGCAAQSQSNSGQNPSPAASPAARMEPAKPAVPEFFDEPKFVVAGVTDAMGPGGHGSDRMVQATDALTKEVGSLERRSPSGETKELVTQAESLRGELRQEPENASKNYRLGALLVRLGRSGEALPYLQKAQTLKPDYTTDYALAFAYGGSGDWQQARSGAQRLLASKDDASGREIGRSTCCRTRVPALKPTRSQRVQLLRLGC